MLKGEDFMRAIEEASRHSIYNKRKLEKSTECACYHCLKVFKPDEVTSWIDDGRTALCPYCNSDSVLGDASDYVLDKETLEKLNKYWFEI
jgi:Zn finger protein HypA/HybF involved in hydrogenase expression